MQINIKTSEKNQEVVRKLTNKLPQGTKENVIARIALGYSLQTGKKFSTHDFTLYDSKGKEYKDHILFDAKFRDFYIALICQHYNIYKSDETIKNYIKLHIDHGLDLLDNIFQSDYNYTFIDFLAEHLDKGIMSLSDYEVTLDAITNKNQNIEKSFFSGPIKIEVGSTISEDKAQSEPIFLTINNTNLYNNCHIAVAGNSGTGKTQFALEFLTQIAEKSNGQVNFIYLDFKGVKQDDVNELKPFFNSTKAKFIDVPKTPFPVNPLTFIDIVNEVDRNMGIDKFVDITNKYVNLGIKQKGKLRQASTEAFLDKKGGEYPTISYINEKLQEIVGDKKDTLTEIVDELSRYKVFQEDGKNKGSFLNENVYLSLSGDLPDSVRFTSLFLIINYIYNTFMNMDNSPVDEGNKAIRYVVLIDEAHVIFREKKYQEILEKMLREIRSKGVSIMLLSQGIEEYNQKDFDFSTMCEMAFLLDIKDRNMKHMEKFLGLSGMSQKIARCMENIEKGQVISNIKEYDKVKLFKVKQYWQRKN